jgi:hypothetical protein
LISRHLTAIDARPYWLNELMTERQSNPGQREPLSERIRDRAKDLIRDIVEALDGLINPAPAPVPIPVRVGPRRRR